MTIEYEIARVHKGMKVHTIDGNKLGKVAAVWLGTGPITSTTHCDEEVCSRIEVHSGFLYVPYSAIAGIAENFMMLCVDTAMAHEHDWLQKPSWITNERYGGRGTAMEHLRPSALHRRRWLSAPAMAVFMLQYAGRESGRGTIMMNPEPSPGEAEPVRTAAQITSPTWRYSGTRAAADAAYCARFGTATAPEPIPMPGGIWAYPLPSTS